jgi:hypothetical protein
MKVTIKKETEETIEIKTPAYFKTSGCHARVNEEGYMKIFKDWVLFEKYNPDNKFFGRDVQDISVNYKPSDELEFAIAYNEVIKFLEEKFNSNGTKE